MFEEKKSTENIYVEQPIIDDIIPQEENNHYNDYNEEKPLVFDTPYNTTEPINNFVAVDNGNEEINKNTNYIFYFGLPESGKSVITATLLYYLATNEGAIEINKNIQNSKEARKLINGFFEDLQMGLLPERTEVDKVLDLNITFKPNNKSQKVVPIDFTFLEISGEDLMKCNDGGEFPEHIDKYLRAKIPLTFIIVTSYDKDKKVKMNIINEFLDKLIEYNFDLKKANIILVITKWDKSGLMQPKGETDIDTYIEKNLPTIKERINTYEFAKTYYTVGNISECGAEGKSKVDKLRLASAKKLSYLLYENITGVPLDFGGTFMEQLKWEIFGK